MSPLAGKLNFRRFILRCVVLAVVLPAAYLLGDFSAGRFLDAQHTEVQASLPETQSPPKAALTSAQEEFWAYLEQFNRLPENPTEEMVAVYNTRGIAPEFQTLKASKKSVIGDIKGLTAHRELFPKRYPWVQPLLDQYEIKIPISTERFSGTAKEIGVKYEKLMMVSWKCKATPENEKTFVTNYLEGLLVVDYVYALGTATDKKQGKDVIDGVFEANSLLDPFRNKLEVNFIAPASRDIGWAAVTHFRELIHGMTPILIRSGFSEISPADRVNFRKWMLRTEGIPEMKTEYHRDFQQDMIYNEQVRVGLISCSIYTLHSREGVRPEDNPGLIVTKILFKRLFPKDHAVQYQRYLSLLDAAYPKTNI